MKRIVLYAAIGLSSGLFFTNIYNSIVNAANWESNIPQSITATRDFFVVANPGTFFRLIDPTTLLLIVLALISNVASEWGRMNWVRSLIWLAGLVCTFLALDKATSTVQTSS